MYYPIRSNTNKVFQVNEKEEEFFGELHLKLSNEQNHRIVLFRMSDGTLSAEYKRYPIGKVKLQGRKFWIQTLKGLYGVKTFEGDLDLLKSHIEDWVKYLNKL